MYQGIILTKVYNSLLKYECFKNVPKKKKIRFATGIILRNRLELSYL